MKLKIKKSKCREVIYLGKTITIPKDHAYVAADYDGVVFSYCEKPTQHSSFWHSSFWHSEKYKKVKGVEMDFEGTPEDWQYSLFYYPLTLGGEHKQSEVS